MEKGLCCFVAITIDDEEICEIHEPLIANDRFVYRCDDKFDIEEWKKLFLPMKNVCGLVFVSGDVSILYQCQNSKEDIVLEKVAQIKSSLINRQKKGGQSSVRFSRLAEESRHRYVSAVMDTMKKKWSNTITMYLFGSRELRNSLCCLIKKTNSFKSVQETDELLRWNEQSWTKQDLLPIISKGDKRECDKIKSVFELLKKNPDWLQFGKEINEKECEYIITCSTKKCLREIVVDSSNPFYTELCKYGTIGKRYFLATETDVETE